MRSNIILSANEHKILFVIGVVICSFYFINLTDKFITNYNNAVESEQIEKRKVANNEDRISFGITECFPTIRIYELILGIQFFTIPLLLLSLRKQHFARFLSSLLLNSFILFGYVGWMTHSYTARKTNEVFSIADTTFNTYIFYQSTILEFILFLAIVILFIIQLVMLLRFVIEKFQAKIS